ncbi:MAG: protein kinase [Thermoanaerobaculia bacterium]|nr:protein kinase [Thermoanaerobaculia bacterium]
MKPGAPGEADCHLIGRRIRQIRVLEMLGGGGMGKVYLGFDETLQRKVALKVIRSRHRLTPEARVRFLREARTLSRLDHPSICGIYDYIPGESTDFLVLELIEGDHLAAAVQKGLDPAQRLAVAIRIAEVLVAAHGEGSSTGTSSRTT